MVLWYGGLCKEVCGAILWVGQQDDSTTLQNIYSMHRWPPLQRRRNEICWRIGTSVLSNCSEMFFLARIGRHDILWSESPNRPKPVTNAWIDWFHIFIILVNTNNIVTSEPLLSNADWNCFKSPILREILRILNLLRVGHCTFFESHTFDPISCMWRTKFSFPQLNRDPWVDNSSPKIQTSLSSMTTIWTLTPPQNQTIR